MIVALAVFSALFVSAACVGADNAPAQGQDFTPAKVAATKTPSATTVPKAAAAPTATTAPVPTATTAPVATTAPAPTVAPTQAPQPTATTVPSPTAAPVVDNGPWMTALEAMAFASATQPGVISFIDGHASSAAGEKDTSDDQNDITSPGAGYGTQWSVAFLLESGSTNFCFVRGKTLECIESSYTPAPADISGITIDSAEVFAAFERTANWNTITAKGELSLLLVLGAGEGELDPTHTYWTAVATAQGASTGIGGGTFNWDLNTDTVTNTTWSY